MLIADRNGMAVGGGVPTARDYVQDGLLLHLDAIDNVGYGQHDANATAWIDLVGGVSLTIPSGSVWSDNSLTLGDDSQVSSTCSWSVYDLYNAGAVTVQSVHELIDVNSDSESMLIQKLTWTGMEVTFGKAWGKMNIWNSFCTNGGASAACWPNYPNGISLQDGMSPLEVASWVNKSDESHAYGWTMLGLEKKRVWNGTVTQNSSLYVLRNDKTYRIGMLGSNVKRKALRVYNRLLTDSERQINYSIDKERFNLTGGGVNA